MQQGIFVLAAAAAAIGFLHTVFGPDHYIPFVVLSRARKWPRRKTMIITLLCGMGHVLSSVVLGLAGVALGIAVFALENIESVRADIATWGLIAFGLTYMVWGIHRAMRRSRHTHIHFHGNGQAHAHLHSHSESHMHIHGADRPGITPWILFTIFVFGPCEPLIPLLIYPASQHSAPGVICVTLVFGSATIGTMLLLVAAVQAGLSFLPLRKMERYIHAMAGGTLSLCGLAMLWGL